MNTYEQIPYYSQPVKRADPELLRTIGHLFGVQGADARNCRVIEVGCGDGGNLLAIASLYPESQFLGLDNSPSAIVRANKRKDELALKNISFEAADILEFESEAGIFDYFLAHGVYSWVADPVKESLLKMARRCLAPTGIGYISYNCLPGWHQRGLLREFMTFHTAGIEAPKLKIAQARAATSYLADLANPKDPILRLLTSTERDTIASLNDWHLFHDYLEVSNDPRYFLGFVEELTQSGLQYLADAELFQMLPLDLPQAEQEKLSKIAGDVLRLEQYLDFFRNRMFRRSLIVQKEAEIRREFLPESLFPLWLSSPMKRGDRPNMYVHPNGGAMGISFPELDRALARLSEVYPEAIAFETLANDCGANHPQQKLRLAGTLLQGVISDLIEARLTPSLCRRATGDQVQSTPLASAQAKKGEVATNLLLDTLLLRKEVALLLSFLGELKTVTDLCPLLRAQGAFRQGASENEEMALLKVWLKELGDKGFLR